MHFIFYNMSVLRKSKNYLIKVLSKLIQQLSKDPNNKGHTIFALPYKDDINNEIINKKEHNSINSDNTIRITSSYIKRIKIIKKK